MTARQHATESFRSDMAERFNLLYRQIENFNETTVGNIAPNEYRRLQSTARQGLSLLERMDHSQSEYVRSSIENQIENLLDNLSSGVRGLVDQVYSRRMR